MNPVIFELGKLEIRWYAVLILIGALLAIYLIQKEAFKFGVSKEFIFNMAFWSIIFGFIGARIYYVVFDWSYYSKHLSEILKIWEGGLAIHGGLIAALITILIYTKKYGLRTIRYLDFICPPVLLAQSIGRWGNFMNQEAFGSATGSSWWGMTSENVAAELGEGVLAHPCFLYESIWCLGGAVLLHFISKKRAFKGEIALCYCVWYGAGRTVIEGLRTDSLYLFGSSIRVSQALSALLVIFGAVMLTIGFKKRKTEEKDARYHNVFGEMSDTVIAAEGVDTGNAIDTDDAVGADGTGETDGVGESDETDETSQNEKAE